VATIDRVSRLAVLAAVVLGLGVVPVSGSAGAQAAACQPDVSIAERGDRVPAGEDLYSPDAVGETRSVLITKTQVLLVVRVKNNGSAPCSFVLTGTHGTGGFDVQYTEPGNDITADVIAGRFLVHDVAPGSTRRFKVRVAAEVDVSLGGKLDVLVGAAPEPLGQVDAARATVTKVTEPLGP
jgi:hypothetical protein